MSCEDIPSLLDLQKVKKHADDFGRLMGTGEGDSTNEVTGQVRPTYNKVMKGLGYTRVGTFATGGTLTNGSQTLLWDIADGGDGQEYGWSGTFPPLGKVVPPSSTPLTTGGISVGSWISRFDPELRGQVMELYRRSDAEAGYNLLNAEAIAALEVKTDRFATPEQFLSLVVSGDWTAAINAAFATGLPVLLSDTYTVSGIINSRGQRIIGQGVIDTSRYSLGRVTAQTIEPDSESVRMLYIESAYDLVELLHIKALGFNTINHYCYFANNGTIDASGMVEQLLDNALTAGLKVNLGTESPRALANLAEFVNATKDHPATWGYSVYDEPATRGISVANQDAKINTLRGLTSKPLSFVDLIAVETGVFTQVFSTNYDVAFVDSYSRHYSSGTYAQWLKDDLNKFRYDFGAVGQMTGLKVIPVVSAFVGNASETYYSRDVDQIVSASTIFGKVAEGNFGAFVWDGVAGSFAGVVRNTPKLKNLVKSLASQRKRKPVKFSAYLFGGTAKQTIWDIQPLIDARKITDSSTSDPNVQGNSYPIRLRTGASETDRNTTTASSDFSGVGFKGAFASWNSGIRTGKHVRLSVEYFNLTASSSGAFSVISTDDNGYTISSALYAAGIGGNAVINADITPGDIGVNADSTLILRVTVGGDTTTLYRKFIRGLIVTSDW